LGGIDFGKTLKINFRKEYWKLKITSYLCTPFSKEGEKTERKSRDDSNRPAPQMSGTKFFEVM
jgi:hypothetical protein